MKTLLGIIVGLVLMSLISCEPQPTQSVQVAPSIVESNLKPLDVFDIPSGRLTVYSYGDDTLYVVEGRNSSYPVGISVK